MAFTSPNNVITGLLATAPTSFCQATPDTVNICNGYNSNYIYYTRLGTAVTLGMAAPGAPTLATNSTGLTGTFQARVRWVDQYSNYRSLGGTAASITLANQGIRYTQPASPPARATHWIIERTINGGTIYYPVNVSSSSPYGTAIATTTYDDATSDTILSNTLAYPNTQGQPNPYLFCFSNQRRVFMGGGFILQTTATLTNGSANVTAGSNFTSIFASQGYDLSVVGDTDGKTYKIITFGSASTLTLASNYTGTTGSKTITIAGPNRDVGVWSEDNQPEAFGSPSVGGPDNLSNWVQIGNDGEPLMGGVGMGTSGVLWAKEQSLYGHYYSENPDGPTGDGRLVQLPTKRGALGPRSVFFVNGFVYGMDKLGIWKLSPGGNPVDISASIANDWNSNQLYFQSGANWHIGYEGVTRCIWFFVTQNTDTYPKFAYIWSEDLSDWVGTWSFDLGVTTSLTLPDSRGIPRLNFYNQTSSTAKSYMWARPIGLSSGADPSGSPYTGTVTSATATTLTYTGASWPTTNDGLSACSVMVEGANEGTTQTQIILSNTSDTVTVSAFSPTPSAGDTFRIAPIHTVYLTPLISPGAPERKCTLEELWIWPRFQGSCVPIKIQLFVNGLTTPWDLRPNAYNQNGMSWIANGNTVTIDPTNAANFFRIPFGANGQMFQFKIFSDSAGEPWNIYKAEVKVRMDQATAPRMMG